MHTSHFQTRYPVETRVIRILCKRAIELSQNDKINTNYNIFEVNNRKYADIVGGNPHCFMAARRHCIREVAKVYLKLV
jgi:hypothetical protein